jgi:FkbM family methyltransferase
MGTQRMHASRGQARKLVDLARRTASRLRRMVAVRLKVDPVTGKRIRKRPDLTRLGSSGGEWTVPADVLGPSAIAYCAGCGEDISFDLALIDRFGCDVWGFDPTPRSIAHVARMAPQQPKYHFHALGLWSERKLMRFFAPKDPRHVSHSLLNMQRTETFFEAKVVRLTELLEEFGHNHLDLLKLDIEGAEYEVLRTLEQDNIFPRVLCVEFDEFFHPLDSSYIARITESVERIIERGYELVHTSGNANYTFLRKLDQER